MPKKRKSDSSSDTSIESDNESKKPTKKSKPDTSKPASTPFDNDPDTIKAWDVGGKKFVKVRTFRGRLFVDIREYYEDKSGELKPGKKGISMAADQWKKICDIVPEITQTVEENK